MPDCGDLACESWFATEDEHYFESTFELTDEDLEVINRDHRVYLNVCGVGHPPIMLTVSSVAEGCCINHTAQD